MKKFIFYMLTGAFFCLLSSCVMKDDGYSIDNAWIGLGLVQKDSVSETFSIQLDDGTVLFPNDLHEWLNKVTNNERVLVNYTILGDKNNSISQNQFEVKVNSIQKILFKGILDISPAIEDSIGNDPIHVREIWMKNNLLNFELNYMGGSAIHYINLVKQPGVIIPGEPVILELRHNKNADTEEFPFSAIVTFDLSSLKVEGKNSTAFKVIAKDYHEPDFEFSGEYKY